MDEEAIQKLAKSITRQFAADWKDTATTQLVERDGNYFLIVKPTLETPNLFGGGVTLQFDLEDKCRHELMRYFPNSSNEEEGEEGTKSHLDPENFAQRRLSKELAHVAITATTLLPFFLDIIETAALHRRMGEMLGPLSQDLQDEISEMARNSTEVMLRALGFTTKTESKPGRPLRAIDDRSAVDALLRSGATSPSRRQLARELNTTPSTVRSWLRMKGFNSPEELMDDFLKRLREARGETEGG